MKKSTWVLGAAALLALSVAVAGCGGGDKKEAAKGVKGVVMVYTSIYPDIIDNMCKMISWYSITLYNYFIYIIFWHFHSAFNQIIYFYFIKQIFNNIITTVTLYILYSPINLV